MRALILALMLTLAAAPTLAQTVIAPADAPKHRGEVVTIEGPVSEVHTDARSGVTFINMGGHFPKQACIGVIFKDDASKSIERVIYCDPVISSLAQGHRRRSIPHFLQESPNWRDYADLRRHPYQFTRVYYQLL